MKHALHCLAFAFATAAGLAGTASANEAEPTVADVHAAFESAKMSPGPLSRQPRSAIFQVANGPFFVQMVDCDAQDRCPTLYLRATIGNARRHDAVRLTQAAASLDREIGFQALGEGDAGAAAQVIAVRGFKVDGTVAETAKRALPQFVHDAQEGAALLGAWAEDARVLCALPGAGQLKPADTNGPGAAILVAPSVQGPNDYAEFVVQPDGTSYRVKMRVLMLDPVFKTKFGAGLYVDGKLLFLPTLTTLDNDQGLGDLDPQFPSSSVGSDTLESILAGKTLTARIVNADGGLVLRRDFPVAPLRAALNAAKAMHWTCLASQSALAAPGG